jgi:hypothetical protein
MCLRTESQRNHVEIPGSQVPILSMERRNDIDYINLFDRDGLFSHRLSALAPVQLHSLQMV